MNGDQELVTVFAVCGVAALATIINGYVLLVILLTKRTSSPINVLLTHLSAVDMIVCIAVLVSVLPKTLLYQYEKFTSWLCPVHGFLFTFLHPLAIWTVCGLNCDRYYAIAAPLHYGTLVNSRKIMLGLGGIWIVCLLISLPTVFWLVPYTSQPGLPVCTTDFSRGRFTIVYSIFYTTITLVVPGVIILGCNIKVFTIARYHRHRIASAIFEVTLSAQVTITHQRNPFFLPTAMANKLRRNNAFAAVFQIVGSLAAFYMPHYSLCLYESLCAALGAQPRTDPALKAVAFGLITGSALCNGLLYGIKNKLLKKTYQNYRRKMMTKCEMNQEIQARTPSACGSRRPSLTPVQQQQHQLQSHSSTGGGGGGGKTITPPVHAALLFRRSSNASLQCEPPPRHTERHHHRYRASGSALDFGNYFAETGGRRGNGTAAVIRRCYSSSAGGPAGAESGGAAAASATTATATNHGAAFVRRIMRDSKRSPRILITRAMSEENESYASEPETPVRKDLVHKLSSSTVTLFIDDCSRMRHGGGGRCGRALESSRDARLELDLDLDLDLDDGDDDDDDDIMSPAYSCSLSSSNDDSSCAAHELTRLTRLSA